MKEPKSINILPPSIFNLLAAGEVVENPAAIVKECCENSIDAGATRIEIEITRGGLDLIKISDNGCGVSGADVENVFAPHATSKISKEDDLEKIGTLGFRGEAMSSIAAVSQIDFTTKTASEKTGTAMRIEGGKIVYKKPVARETGTDVTVANLFYNTPARAKFLRPANAEKNAVTSVVSRIILSHPDHAVRYSIDGDTCYEYRGKRILDAIKAVYGDVDDTNVLRLDKVSQTDGGKMSLLGYVGIPTFCKRNRTTQTVIVNGRPVEGGIIADAVNDVFSNFMTVGNFPFFVLMFGIDLHDVDVNIHPRKAQVKFSNSAAVTEFVRAAAGEVLDEYLRQKHTINFDPREDDEILRRIALFQSADNGENLNMVKSADHIMNMFDLAENPIVPVLKNTEAKQQKMDTAAVDKFNILGTVFNTYILVEDDTKFHIIDQHAAHERQLFDKLSRQIDARRVEKQRLLNPEVLVLSAEEMTKMENAAETLNACGIECEPFGARCFRITAVPVIVANNGIGELCDAILGDVRSSKVSEILRDKIVMQCCKSAVKAGQKLPSGEIRALVRDITNGTGATTCPHGRPFIKSFTKTEIEKMFARK